MEKGEKKIWSLESEVARLKRKVKNNEKDIGTLIEYLRIKFPKEWTDSGTIILVNIKKGSY